MQIFVSSALNFKSISLFFIHKMTLFMFNTLCYSVVFIHTFFRRKRYRKKTSCSDFWQNYFEISKCPKALKGENDRLHLAYELFYLVHAGYIGLNHPFESIFSYGTHLWNLAQVCPIWVNVESFRGVTTSFTILKTWEEENNYTILFFSNSPSKLPWNQWLNIHTLWDQLKKRSNNHHWLLFDSEQLFFSHFISFLSE